MKVHFLPVSFRRAPSIIEGKDSDHIVETIFLKDSQDANELASVGCELRKRSNKITYNKCVGYLGAILGQNQLGRAAHLSGNAGNREKAARALGYLGNDFATRTLGDSLKLDLDTNVAFRSPDLDVVVIEADASGLIAVGAGNFLDAIESRAGVGSFEREDSVLNEIVDALIRINTPHSAHYLRTFSEHSVYLIANEALCAKAKVGAETIMSSRRGCRKYFY